jgi:hypothetical protein
MKRSKGSIGLSVAIFKESNPRSIYAASVLGAPFAADLTTVWSAANFKESEVLQESQRATQIGVKGCRVLLSGLTVRV